ncbi:hypothetical protein IGK71_000125 [Enterococcus sp. DIV0343]
MNPFKTTLSTVLHFNEFKSIRHVSIVMSFIILNGQTRKLLDIVGNQLLPLILKNHFLPFLFFANRKNK